jgi:hypothetical protein
MATGLGACAAPQTPYRTPDHWSKESYEWPSGSEPEANSKIDLEKPPSARRAKNLEPIEQPVAHPTASAPTKSERLFFGRIAPPEATRAPLHRGEQCLSALKKRGVSFTPLAELEGVENPVEVRGPLGGVVFYANDHRPLRLDCRLAIALEDLEPVFHSYGVTRVRFSGAYVYRTTRSGRLSHHALGLAIDIHEIFFGSRIFSVEDDFEMNVGCQPDNPTLNELACALRQTRYFEEFLTPDFNRDHRDHLHISVPRRRGPSS